MWRLGRCARAHLLRVIRCPSRGRVTGLAVAACALTAVMTGRREFLDVGLGLALIAFLATIAFAAFLEKKEGSPS